MPRQHQPAATEYQRCPGVRFDNRETKNLGGKRRFSIWVPYNFIYTRENQHCIGTSQFSIGNTSSNGGCSIFMFVFWGYGKPQTLTWPLKINGWKMKIPLGSPIFRSELLVSGRVTTDENKKYNAIRNVSPGSPTTIFLLVGLRVSPFSK